MDNSLSENELSMSPSHILERLELLRHMQLMQREKLQKQRLLYQESHESSSTYKDNASDFTNSTSYSRLPQEINEGMSSLINNIILNVEEKDLSDGVAVLNLSQESELLLNSPMSSTTSKAQSLTDKSFQGVSNIKTQIKKQIALDDMPILSPRKDFETMLLEKIQNDNQIIKPDLKVSGDRNKNKKPFLKRGEGMARFGLNKKDLVVEKTSSLPWRNKSLKVISKAKTATPNTEVPVKSKEDVEKVNIQNNLPQGSVANCVKSNSKKEKQVTEELQSSEYSYETIDSSNCEIHAKNKPVPILKKPTVHPLKANKGKTWAAVFTKEQDEFLKQLKQSEYYKNFASPSKSIASELSCNESFIQLRQERETAEQNMFNLLENKVMNESFTLESSFFNKFLRNSQFECSGESTPLVLQRCLAKNPNLLHIHPEIINKRSLEETNSDVETCDSEYTDCDNETCTSVSSCCSSCVTTKEKKQPGFEENTSSSIERKNTKKYDLERKKVVVEDKNDKCPSDIINENDAMKANMTEMNNKLIATSDLLKDRLKELEDEIETFRKENSNLIKLREEVDTERQKLYEEKSAYEQKFNEEKILSEYYLAEEKEKLNKQKLIYEKYVREIRGRLNKKDKDEVVNLKKEISNLKDEIRIKDAKSTSTIARLRNQLKILEKEKNNLQEQVAKIEKENRRLHHSNEMTRRLTNIKYLEQINKKLLSVPSKTTESSPKEDNNVKYKSYEIERQSRNRRIQAANENTIRPRAKSVPNMNVTSRYAKYFSQKDVASDIINKKPSYLDTNDYDSEVDDYNDNYDEHQPLKLDDEGSTHDENESNDIGIENNLERLYVERFKSAPSCENKSNNSNSDISLDRSNPNMDHSNGFFFRKSNSIANSDSSHRESPGHRNSTESTRSKSPISVVSQRPCLQDNSNPLTNKAPASILSNRSSGTQISTNGNYINEINRNTEPFISKTSVTRTNLNPREIIKSDGTRELTFSNGNVKLISPDGKYTKFIYYNGDVKENFYGEGRIKYFYAETKTYHTTHPDGLEVLEFPDGQIEKRYKDGSSEIRLPNGSVRYQDPKSQHVKEEWRFPDGTTMTVSATGEQRVVFPNGQVEVHAKDHKRREFPDGTVKLVYSDGTSETRYSSGRVRIKDKQGNLIMDSAPDG